MKWQIQITSSARKQLRRIPVRDKERILDEIEMMKKNPYFGDIMKLEGKGSNWRCRIGNYRIIYELFLDEKQIFIYEIKRRTSTTYKKR